MQESNVTKIDFGSDKETITDESEDYIYKMEDGYYVEIVQHNGSRQTLTSKDKSYKGCKEIYSYVKEELNEKIKSVALFKYEDGIRKDNFSKSFKPGSQPYNTEEFLSLIVETSEQISKLKKYIEGINTYQSMSDKVIDVMHHAIECRDYNDSEEMAMDLTALKSSLVKRREIKNLMFIADNIKKNKNLFDINTFSEEHQNNMMKHLRNELTKRRDKGIAKCITVDDKIKVIYFNNEEERQQAFSSLKNEYNCVKEDKYKNYVTGYDLIYKK